VKKIRYYVPELVGIFTGLLALNLWYFSSLAVTDSIAPRSYEYLVQAVIIAIGAFIGSWSAVKLNESKEASESYRRRKEALNQAIFVIARQMNAVQLIKRDIQQYREGVERAFNLPPQKPPVYSDLRQDISSLSFILETDAPQLLLELTVEQERFDQAIESINVRNEFYVHQVQPAVSQQGLPSLRMTRQKLKDALGERIFGGAMQGARELSSHIVETDASLSEFTAVSRIFQRGVSPVKGLFTGRSNNKALQPTASPRLSLSSTPSRGISNFN
tara:strand:- start:329 stop:1150 length:822 start_codon:yes stop_codon:yes gene_type:complete